MRKLGIALLACTSACSFFNSALYGAGDQAGRNVGASVVGGTGAPQGGQGASYGAGAQGGGAQAAAYGGGGNMSMATMNPAVTNMYMGVIFTYAFSSGGYDVSQADYKAGQYTRWNGHGQNGKSVTVERAHLFDDAQGRQWWKVKFSDDKGKTTILEGLLDPAQHKFVRMRAKFPDDKDGNEMPMTDSSYYQPPQKLSPESVEGANKGPVSVSVPAGSFTAKHIVFGGATGSNEWWLENSVPGGVVKQLGSNQRGQGFEMDLASYGNDAQSELGTK